MSKMSELHMELSEQASELGFESIEEAEANGYDVCYGEEGAYLYEKRPEDEQLKAHKAWLEERDILLKALDGTLAIAEQDGRTDDVVVIKKAIDFIKKGEM